MVWNVLWMAAMAAASALAGFCMGRLSARNEDAYEEEGQGGPGRQRRRAVLETGGLGEWSVPFDHGGRGAAEAFRAETADWAGEGSAAAVEAGTDGRADGSQRMRYAGEQDQVSRRFPMGGAGWLSDRCIRGTGGSVRPIRRGLRGKNQQAPEGQKWSVGSPVKGWLTSCRDDGHPTVVIQPEEDRLYAPAGGKVVKLFPMGNAFLFRTEFGTELYLQVGNVKDDLLGRYFRPRVVQNEIVPKGKLLLEFDSMKLVSEGISPAVTVSVENHSYNTSVHVTAAEMARVGEEILLVSERRSMDAI